MRTYFCGFDVHQREWHPHFALHASTLSAPSQANGVRAASTQISDRHFFSYIYITSTCLFFLLCHSIRAQCRTNLKQCSDCIQNSQSSLDLMLFVNPTISYCFAREYFTLFGSADSEKRGHPENPCRRQLVNSRVAFIFISLQFVSKHVHYRTICLWLIELSWHHKPIGATARQQSN